MTGTATLLLAVLMAGHFLGDYTGLSTPKMLEAKSSAKSPGWILMHAGVHSVLVGVAVAVIAAPGWSVVSVAAAIQFLTHFAIDALRAWLGVRRPRLRDPDSKSFWYVLGLDQLAHGLVLVAILAYVLGTAGG